MKNATLADIMADHPIKISEEIDTGTVTHLLLRYRINGILIVDKDTQSKLIGIFTTTDCLRLLGEAFSNEKDSFDAKLEEISEIPVGEVATKDIISLQIDTPITEAIKIMHLKNVHTIPIFDKEKLVGVVGRHDLLNIAFS